MWLSYFYYYYHRHRRLTLVMPTKQTSLESVMRACEYKQDTSL